MKIQPRLIGRVARRARWELFRALGRTSFGTITSVVTSAPKVAITFDDGPDPGWTPQVLDVLHAHQAKATFFVIGKFVDAHADVMRRLHARGHALGNHTYNHRSMPLLDRDKRRGELERCAKALAAYPQERRLLRPPYLDQDLASRFDSWQLGYEVIACSLHARDWEDRSGEEMAHVLVAGAKPGDIIMLHDSVRGEASIGREAMLQALDSFLSERKDLRFVTVPELLMSGRPRREIWFRPPSAAGRASYDDVI